MRISLPKLKSTVASVESFLESRVYASSCSTLWNCLLDDADDSIIYETFRVGISANSMIGISGALHHILRLRGDILHQLQEQFTIDSANSLPGNTRGSIFHQSHEGIARVYNATTKLSSYINSIDEVSQ